MNDVAIRVIDLVADHFGIPSDRVRPDTNLEVDFNWDDLDPFELAMDMSEEFDITIFENESDNAKTVDQWIKMVESKLD